MATNNYFGFTHGGTQYTAAAAAATGAAYQASQAGYAVAAPATVPPTATYGTQRATGYESTAYQTAATAGTYAAVGTGTPTAATAYDYGYGRAAAANAAVTQAYDSTKNYYQQTAIGQSAVAAAAAAANYSAAAAAGYDQSCATVKTTNYAAAYTQRNPGPQQNQTVAVNVGAKPSQYTGTYQANATGYQTSYGQPSTQTTIGTQQTNQNKRYDAALYSAATMYVAQQSGAAGGSGGVNANHQKGGASSGSIGGGGGCGGGWQGYNKNKTSMGGGQKTVRTKAPPKPQQLHYCDVCKISCAGPQTYREHLEGQKHKKREAATKMAASVAVTSQNRSGNSLRCQLCDVTCTGNDAYAAHIRGSKHSKVVMLHTKLGKPIPPQEPEVVGGVRKSVTSAPKINFIQSAGLASTGGSGSNAATATTTTGNGDGSLTSIKDDDLDDTPEPDIQPVGQDYIEEMKSDDGKVISFNCKLCECRFNDPNAKEMHMKGRRHRLQYKKKVNPDLVVDVKPSLRQRKIIEEKMRRAALREEYWQRRHMAAEDEEERLYWEERRRYEEDYMEWCRRGNMGPFPRGRPPFSNNGPPLFFQGPQIARRLESNDDRHVMAHHSEIYPKEEELQNIQRIVSHTERALKIISDQMADVANPENKTTVNSTEKSEDKAEIKEDGRDNQLFSFQKEERDNNRTLKGVMRVGQLAKGLLLQGDDTVELIVLCADKPTLSLLRKVIEMLPAALKSVSSEHAYHVTMNAAEAGFTVTEEALTVLVQLTSPVMREQDAASGSGSSLGPGSGSDRDVLARGKCLQALAALRHTKWFQARALGLHSCVVIIRILRDLCQRVPTWSPLSSWAMELLVEKVISSVPGGMQLSPGDGLRRVMEAVAGGLLLPGGPGLGDPCEKDSPDATSSLTAQQREDLTCSAQYALRLIAYRQIYKVLGMEQLPILQKIFRRDRSARKRRRSGGEQPDSESDTGKMVKTETMETSENTVVSTK